METDDVSRINAYLDGEMTVEEQTAFKVDLQQDSDLQEMLYQIRDMRAALKSHERQKLKHELAKEWQSLQKKNTVPKLSLAWFRSAGFAKAAIVAGLVLVSILYWFISNEKEQDLLVLHLNDIYPAPTVMKTNIVDENIHWQTAVAHYQKKEFAAFITALHKIPFEEWSKEQQFYAALGFMYQQPPDYYKANVLLHSIVYPQDQIISTPDPLFGEQARWFLALALLEQNEEKAAKQELTIIVKNKTWKHKDAEKLLETIVSQNK